MITKGVYLTGNHIQPAELKNHIGKNIVYLISIDIDKSGRGYYFPKRDKIQGYDGRTRSVILAHEDYVPISSFVEIVIADEHVQYNQ